MTDTAVLIARAGKVEAAEFNTRRAKNLFAEMLAALAAQVQEIERLKSEAFASDVAMNAEVKRVEAQAKELERLKDWSKHSPGNATASLIVEMTQRAEAAEARVRDLQSVIGTDDE